jgi:hypothetical protein
VALGAKVSSVVLGIWRFCRQGMGRPCRLPVSEQQHYSGFLNFRDRITI